MHGQRVTHDLVVHGGHIHVGAGKDRLERELHGLFGSVLRPCGLVVPAVKPVSVQLGSLGQLVKGIRQRQTLAHRDARELNGRGVLAQGKVAVSEADHSLRHKRCREDQVLVHHGVERRAHLRALLGRGNPVTEVPGTLYDGERGQEGLPLVAGGGRGQGPALLDGVDAVALVHLFPGLLVVCHVRELDRAVFGVGLGVGRDDLGAVREPGIDLYRIAVDAVQVVGGDRDPRRQLDHLARGVLEIPAAHRVGAVAVLRAELARPARCCRGRGVEEGLRDALA